MHQGLCEVRIVLVLKAHHCATLHHAHQNLVISSIGTIIAHFTLIKS